MTPSEIGTFMLSVRTRSAAQALPTYWSMQGMLDILVRDQGVEGILLESGVLLGFALVFFLIGVLRFRYE